MAQLTRNGTDGRVYGGDAGLVHIEDGKRADAGAAIAEFVDTQMRQAAALRGKEYYGVLCPGCVMIALFNASIHLAREMGQPLTELGNTMAKAYAELAKNPEAGLTEEIEVILDDD